MKKKQDPGATATNLKPQCNHQIPNGSPQRITIPRFRQIHSVNGDYVGYLMDKSAFHVTCATRWPVSLVGPITGQVVGAVEEQKNYYPGRSFLLEDLLGYGACNDWHTFTSKRVRIDEIKEMKRTLHGRNSSLFFADKVPRMAGLPGRDNCPRRLYSSAIPPISSLVVFVIGPL